MHIKLEKRPADSSMKRSAVAMILSERPEGPAILMIKRAEHESDPWSGHMAFPGGRMDPEDVHGHAVAVRETEEEIGLTLDDSTPCIGRLADLRARAIGRELPMFISPFVFRVDHEPVLEPNHEVAEVVWVPLAFLVDEKNRDSMFYESEHHTGDLPCYYFEGRCIWGLSLMMLDELMGLVS